MVGLNWKVKILIHQKVQGKEENRHITFLY